MRPGSQGSAPEGDPGGSWVLRESWVLLWCWRGAELVPGGLAAFSQLP